MELSDGFPGTSAGPESPPLMRMVLQGGTLVGEGDKEWKIWKDFDPNGDEYQGFFAGEVNWTRTITDAEGLTLTIRQFDKTEAVEIPLRPVKVGERNVISLKVANLCCNPMEWEELKDRPATGGDKDFKWLYRLLNPQTSTYDKLLEGGKQLPHPNPLSIAGLGREHCIGGKPSWHRSHLALPRFHLAAWSCFRGRCFA